LIQQHQSDHFKCIEGLSKKISCFGVITKECGDDAINNFLAKNFTCRHFFNFTWQDLKDETKNFLINKSINFQERIFTLSNLL
ncbi:hypothetical protein, partial [Shewanella xiamenensis]|uniref:hypothetical protein n=1 Tax=Shewanella xiamenensis TaxID=332186 RepID=UPI0024A6A24C